MDYYAIGQRIRKFRKAHGLSQEELGEKVGISTTHMSHIETGNTKLSLSVFVSIVEALEVSADDLLFEKPCESHNKETAEINAMLENCSKNELKFIADLIRTAQISIKKFFDC